MVKSLYYFLFAPRRGILTFWGLRGGGRGESKGTVYAKDKKKKEQKGGEKGEAS